MQGETLKLRYQILWKSVQWEQSCSMRADRWSDRHDEANSRFTQFCESAQNSCMHYV